MKIVIIQVNIECDVDNDDYFLDRAFCQLGINSIQQYAAKHNYDYICFNSFTKESLLKRSNNQTLDAHYEYIYRLPELHEYDYVIYIDTDVICVNDTQKFPIGKGILIGPSPGDVYERRFNDVIGPSPGDVYVHGQHVSDINSKLSWINSGIMGIEKAAAKRLYNWCVINDFNREEPSVLLKYPEPKFHYGDQSLILQYFIENEDDINLTLDRKWNARVDDLKINFLHIPGRPKMKKYLKWKENSRLTQ